MNSDLTFLQLKLFFNMTINNRVEKLFGPDVEKYFDKKLIGGKSNQKGARYEDFFSVMQLAQLFHLLTTGSSAQDIKINAQAEGFVDDLLIVYKNESYHHFQLKTSSNISWGRGSKSISDDFHKQKLLNNDMKIGKTYTFLVCSNKNQFTTLKEKIPNDIVIHTNVIFFPEAETINELIFIHEEFKSLIENICLSSDSDKLESLAKLILAHWVDKKTTIFTANELLKSLEESFPNFLAKENIAVKLIPEVEQIFSYISHFSYKIERGYFSWCYGDSDSGTIPYSVDSEKFMEFQKSIISERPQQFGELEGVL